MSGLCACLGPLNGDPHCMCTMISLGLKTKADFTMSAEKKAELAACLSKVFGWAPADVEEEWVDTNVELADIKAKMCQLHATDAGKNVIGAAALESHRKRAIELHHLRIKLNQLRAKKQ